MWLLIFWSFEGTHEDIEHGILRWVTEVNYLVIIGGCDEFETTEADCVLAEIFATHSF